MSVLSLHHVQVLAPRGAEAAARSFYGEMLGLREIPRPGSLPPGGAWFELDDGRQIHVGVFRDGDEPTRNRSHVALIVQSLEAVRRRLESRGVPYGPAEFGDVPGWRRIRARDPFGNGIELIELADEPEQPR